MAKLKSGDLFCQITTHASRTSLGSPTWIDVAVPQDGATLANNFTTETIPTDHGSDAPLYQRIADRNSQEISLSFYPFPNMMGTILDTAFERDSSNEMANYFALRNWYSDRLGGSNDKGKQAMGCLGNSFSLTVDRSTADPILTMEMGVFPNQITSLSNSETTPTPSFTALQPYSAGMALIDFIPDTTVTAAFSGDNTDVKSVTFQWQNNIELSGFAPSTTTALDGSWTEGITGDMAGTVTVVMDTSSDDILQLGNSRSIVNGKLRLVLVHPTADSTTTDTDIATGTASDQVLAFTSAANFAVGDVVLIRDVANNKFVFLPIASKSSNNVTFANNTSSQDFYVAITTNGLTVQNTAWGFIINSMQLSSPPSGPVRSGGRRRVTLTYTITASSTQTHPIIWYGYNHS